MKESKPLTEKRIREIIREELSRIIVINPIINVYPERSGEGGGYVKPPSYTPSYPTYTCQSNGK